MTACRRVLLEVAMSGRALRPLALPDGFWTRTDVSEVLRQRDCGALFRLIAKYSGASQTQLAIATELTQGQISDFMRGIRIVKAIDVAERILAGLAAPDSAWLAFGLAPRNASSASAWASGETTTDTGFGDVFDLADDEMDRRGALRVGGAAAFAAVAIPAASRAQRLGQLSRSLTWYPALSSSPTTAAPPTVGQLTAMVGRAKRDYQACRYAAALDELPAVLEAVRLLCESAGGDELLRGYALAADAYQVTASVMLKMDDVGLAAFAADRCIDAASHSGDPVTVAASTRAIIHSLLRGGHAGRAAEMAEQAAQRLAGELDRTDAEAVSVYGALLLRGASAAAKAEDRDVVARLLDEAEGAARRLDDDRNMHWTAFNPSNVAQHRVYAAMVLGDAGTAVELARRIDVTRIPIAERKASLFIDTASAFVQWGKHEQAYRALRTAEQMAPEEVRTHRTVRNLLGDLADRAPRDVRSRVRDFASQIGARL